VGIGRRREFSEPFRKRDEAREGPVLARVELSNNVTDDAGCVVITAMPHQVGQRVFILGTLQKDCFAFSGQHQRHTLTIPPRHKLVAEFFFGLDRYFEYSRHALPSHR